MTRERIEAAVGRRQKWNDAGQPNNSYDVCECPYDADILADAYLTERAERQRRIEAAAEEIAKTCAYTTGGTVAFVRDIITRHLDGETT